jgi:hypothetical protein
MKITSRCKSIIYLIVILISSSILAKEDHIKYNNIKVEFFFESVNNGLIEKFKNYLYNDEIDDNQDNNEDISLESSESSLYINDSITETDEFFIKLKENSKVLNEYGNIPDNYKKNAEKICLLTVIAKETTINIKENMRV